MFTTISSLHIFRSWEQFFQTTKPAITTQNTRVYSSNARSYYITGCFFNGLTISGDNGAAIKITVTESNSNFLCEDCTFLKSKATRSGGSIFVENANGGIVVQKCCAVESKTNSTGQSKTAALRYG